MKTNKQIVIMTLIAMICVVAGHCDITDNYKKLWIFRWVYSFHMPVSFFISGFLFALTNPNALMVNRSILGFYKKKFVRLMMPFLFINSIIFIIKASLIHDISMLQNPVNLSFKSFIDVTFIHPIGFMWFLPALFMIFVFVYPVYKKINDNRYFIIILLSVILFCSIVSEFTPIIKLMQITRALYFCPYFILGIFYFRYKSTIDKYLKSYWSILLPIVTCLSVSLLLKGFSAALVGIIMCTLIGILLENKCSDTAVKLSKLCYMVFLLSYFPQMFIRGPVAHHFPNINEYLLSALSFISGIMFPMILGLILLKIKPYNKVITKTSFLVGI